MKTALFPLCLLISLPSPLSFVQDPPLASKPAPESPIIVASHASLTCTLIITGTLTKKTDEAIGSWRLRPTIESCVVWNHGGAWVGRNNDEKSMEGISQALNETLASKDILDKLEKQKPPADDEKVATFTFYLANCHRGNFRQPTKQAIFFQKEESQCTGLVEVHYVPPFTPTTQDQSTGLLTDIEQAFYPLADRFDCQNIWIVVGGIKQPSTDTHATMSVVWGGPKHWSQFVTNPSTKATSPEK